MRSLLLLASLVAYAAATGRPLGNRLAELVHQDPLNEEKLDKMLSLIDDAEEMNLAHPGNGMTAATTPTTTSPTTSKATVRRRSSDFLGIL